MDRKSEIKQNIARVEAAINRALKDSGRSRTELTCIAVTKNFPVTDIEILYDLGIRDFGENKEQEAQKKVAYFRGRLDRDFSDIRWHFQGQLQRNKLASIGSWAYMVHSVDDVKYLKGLADSASSQGRSVRALIQISLDTQKSSGRGGIDIQGAREILRSYENSRNPGLEIVGLMGVAPIEENPSSAFERLNMVFLTLQKDAPYLSTLSAGMSGDFESAIRHGATHLRIGSSILGNRAPAE